MYKTCDWTRLFSMNIDGVSTGTFYEKCKKWKVTLLVVKEKHGYIFGAYCTDTWRTSSKFYGTGETFLFTFKD